MYGRTQKKVYVHKKRYMYRGYMYRGDRQVPVDGREIVEQSNI